MNFLDKLERKYGKFALPNLMTYIVLGNALVFLLVNLNPAFYNNFTFSWSRILQGEIWRLITFIFIPMNFSLIWVIFSVMLYYYVGTALERAWGAFRFNVYYLTGMLGTIIVSILFNIQADATYLNLSLFLGFATMFPDLEFRIYFILPVKAKWMAIVYFVILGFDVVTGLLMGSIAPLILVVVSLINYFLFFGLTSLKRTVRRQQYKQNVSSSYKTSKKHIPKGSSQPLKVAFHRCHTCGKTELDDPDLEFRYCSKCNGHYEYCMEHLRNHEHVE